MWVFFDKLMLFLANFFNAVKFSAFDYDAKLQLTKTPRQRLIIWLFVIGITILVIYLLLTLLGVIIRPLLENVKMP